MLRLALDEELAERYERDRPRDEDMDVTIDPYEYDLQEAVAVDLPGGPGMDL